MFFDDYEPAKPKGMKRDASRPFRSLEYPAKKRVFSQDPFNDFAPGDEVMCDTECLPNYWLAAFKHKKTGAYFYIEKRRGEQLDTDALGYALFYFKIITFNGRYYDMQMIANALEDLSTDALKEASDGIILHDERKFTPEKYNHVDLIEVAPLPNTSLKTYAGRIHAKRMQEIPVDIHADASDEDIDNTREYCFNDLDNTDLLHDELEGPLKLRNSLTSDYGVDLRSKSDAQIAEAVIVSELRDLGVNPKRLDVEDDYQFTYKAPDFVAFQTPAFQAALDTITTTPFTLDKGGSPKLPKSIAGLQLRLGSSVYRLGAGGLHSSEKGTAHRSDDTYQIIDRDVASYYPFIILNNGYYPQHLGEAFLEVYRTIVERRLKAKAASKTAFANGDTETGIMWAIVSDGLKITINGTFGKLGNRYSAIYSPDLLIQVTIGGQLCLLMLIEAIELAGIAVVSANTDGIVIKCPHEREHELEDVITIWEAKTGFVTEETRYNALYSRDVNNYIAVTTDNKCKVKGVYSERGSALNSVLSKNPEYLVCSDAVQAFLANGTPVEETIERCSDIRRFVAVRNVRGGAHKGDVYLGKVVRWYFAKRTEGAINYVSSGNKVPNSIGAKPLMQLDQLPDDIDYRWYVERAYRMIDELGYYGNKTQQASLL